MRPFVFLSAFGIAVCLLTAAGDLNFVGSDDENLCLPAARQLPFVNYLSELSQSLAFDNAGFVRGKEVAIWHFQGMRRLLNDQDSLRPFLLTVIIFWALSAILVYFVCASYWGTWIGLVSYLLFITSFWPYVYVLFVKHQPVGLFYFLAAVFVLNWGHVPISAQGRKRLGIGACPQFSSGVLMATALQASTVAVLYVPFYMAALYHRCRGLGAKWFTPVMWAGLGFAAMFWILNYPHFVGNIREFLEYARSNRMANHFAFHQNVFRGWMVDPQQTYGGWEWTIKYLFLAMPVLFSAYCAMAVYTVAQSSKLKVLRRKVESYGMILLSLSPAIIANSLHAAQYGSSYFPCMIGVMMFLAYSLRHFGREPCHPRFRGAVCGAVGMHIVINAFIFFTDVFPNRMASVYLSRALHKLKGADIYAHPDNPQNKYVIGKMDPFLLRDLSINPIRHIYQPKDGYIVVSPAVASSIYLVMPGRYADFDEDIFLNELLRRNTLENYAVAVFPTMASSRIWRQEEETLSYRDLILGQFQSEEYQVKSRVWILDVTRLIRDRLKNEPNPEYQDLVKRGVRNVGNKSGLYRYKGVAMHFNGSTGEPPGAPIRMDNLKMRLYKIGSPSDQLAMYVYKRQVLDNALAWLPWGEHYASRPVDGGALTADPMGQEVPFVFNQTLTLTPGDYHFVLYRNGQESNTDFYRVYIDETERQTYSHILFSAGL